MSVVSFLRTGAASAIASAAEAHAASSPLVETFGHSFPANDKGSSSASLIEIFSRILSTEGLPDEVRWSELEGKELTHAR